MSGTEERMQSIAEKRKEARKLKDPHHMQPFQRYFLGPTPVSSNLAPLMAQAIAEDVKIEKPAAIGIVDRDGRVITGRRSSQDSLPSQASPVSNQRLRPIRSLSPLRMSRGPKSSSSYLERSSFLGRPTRNASFTSAKSAPDTVLSEGHLPRGAPLDNKRLLNNKRSMTSDADVSYIQDDSLATPTRRLTADSRIRRGESSSYDPPRDLGRKKLSFEVMSPTDRRGRSEGSPAPGASILQKEHFDLETPSRRLTHLSINEEESDTPKATPTGARYGRTLHPLRSSASHRSIGFASRNISDTPATPPPHAKSSDPPLSIITDGDTSLGFDTGRPARLQNLRERARKRYGQGDIGKGRSLQHTSTQQSGMSHGRDISRQSRLSRASTAGTLASSIGTRITDGSFGATGGVRAKLLNRFGASKPSKSVRLRARDIKLEHLRHGRGHIKGGVMPGAVGTSAGGTRWVGQSFLVGKRFWEVVHTREEELSGDTIDEEALQEEALDEADERKSQAAAIRRAVDIQHARQESLSKDPDAVIDLFARDASRAINDASSHAGEDVERKSGKSVQTQQVKSKTSQQMVAVESRPRRMSTKEALSHPEPPLGAEEKFPQATHELLRRTSNPGIRVDHGGDDAASDFEVAARPTYQTPQEPSPSFKWNGRGSSSTTRNRSNSTSSLVGKSPRPTSSTPLLRKRASAIGIMVNGKELESAHDRSNKMSNGLSILRDTGFEESHDKKTVQFQKSDSLAVPMGRNFLRTSPTKELEGLTLLAGRTKKVVKGDDAPAPPEEVLSRNATPDGLKTPQLLEMQASPSASFKAEEMVTIRSVLRRDRMLVRLAWTPSDNLPKDFTERDSRKYPIYSEPFKEYMVVYRTGRLELWEDPSLMSKCLGHGDQLRLSAAVSLKRGRAFVSTYSYIDRIFCLTFVKDDDSHHRILHLRKSGTYIWFFDARSISLNADWTWELWRELGGVIPQNVDIHIPVFSVRVRIPVPDEVRAQDTLSQNSESSSFHEGEEGYKVITPKYVKAVVRQVIEHQPEWMHLCRMVELTGMQFELAWRSGPTLNWVKDARTVDGHRRDWCVMAGAIISEPQRPSILEYRTAVHYPTSVRMPKGDTMQEPTGIEGFVWRVKAVSGALSRLYLTTHDGLIFANRSSKAFPPDRHLAAAAADTTFHPNTPSPFALSEANDHIEQDRRRKRDAIRGRKRGMNRDASLAELRRDVMSTLVQPPTTEEEIDSQIEAYRAFEKRRQFEQIANCDGYVDMRDIIEIRSLADTVDIKVDHNTVAKANGEVKANGHSNGAVDGDNDGKDHEEEEDLGGEEGLALANDRDAMKRSRQFEVTLSNGRSIRFEVYSKSVAKEWIERMTELSVYWKRREKVDAMELMTACGISPTLTGKQKTFTKHEPRAIDQSTEGVRLSTVLGNIWHWCTHLSCRGIIRSGRLFQKKQAFSGFYSRYYILIAGRLLHFKLMTGTSTARARQNSGIFHRRQETVVHLRDAYVYSGQLTEEMLINGRSEGASSINTYGSGSGGSANTHKRHLLPRVYADGLMSFDDDEDCTLVVRYRPQRLNQAADPAVRVGSSMVEQLTTPASSSSIPKLGDTTYNHLVLRARCKLERDLWVRAINIECERLVRMDREREEKIRNQGETPWKSGWHRR